MTHVGPSAPLDRRVIVALLSAAIGGVAALQLADPETWLALAPGAGRGVPALYWARVWQAAVLLAVYVAVPLALARAVGVRAADLGLRLGDAHRYLHVYGVVLALALPIVVVLSFTTGFRHVYPAFAPAVLGGWVLAAWLALLALMLFAVELFYRGFLLAMLSPAFGRYAVFVMVVPYALTHREPVEALGAIGVGLLLGVLAQRSRSIWIGWLTHTSIAWLVEMVAVWQARRHCDTDVAVGAAAIVEWALNLRQCSRRSVARRVLGGCEEATMRRSAWQTFFRGALVAALPLSLGVAQATTPACARTFIVPAPTDDGGLFQTDGDGGSAPMDCNQICGGYGYWCETAAADAGPPGSVACHTNRCTATICGRLTNGVVAAAATGDGDVVARHLTEAAYLEAAAVLAFDRLADELAAHGAPIGLVARARAAARDEVRHARIIGALARQHGGRPARVAPATLPLRALDEVAQENAAEGCVRETYGALVASWQGLASAEPTVRRALRSVSVDERRHAELSWAVARWAEPRLGATVRRRVRRARQAAVVELARQIDVEPPALLVRAVGLPSRPVARALFTQAHDQLWLG